jgi:putative transposase
MPKPLLAPQEIRTFFVTSVVNGRRCLLQSERSARLFMEVLQFYRAQSRYLLHEFVVMPDHIHLILTPAPDIALEKAVQYIKGGHATRAREQLGLTGFWQPHPSNHRIRDAADYERHRNYIHQNPVKACLAVFAEEYPYSSAFPGAQIDPAPPALKRKT